MNNKFDDLRPYYDKEIPDAMERIVTSSAFPILSAFVFPEEDKESVRRLLLQIKTTEQFQKEVMMHANNQIVKRTINELTFTGNDKISKKYNHLYMSNHRDIALDAMLTQMILAHSGLDTCEITFGANLMSSQLVIDIGKSNKMFKVERSGSLRDFYNSSFHLSEYLRYVITEKNRSIWTAQRNGRTKDGIDATDQGIIKMLSLSLPNDKIKSIDDFHIIPISISYEWEPCDELKTLEIYASRRSKYIKKPGEDLNSILTGILQFKGNVHIVFNDEITKEELQAFDKCTQSDFDRNVAALIDCRINNGYKLGPNNYIAHDLRYGQTKYKDYYSDEQKHLFIEHMKCLNKYYEDGIDIDELKDIFLSIYSNSIRQQ